MLKHVPVIVVGMARSGTTLVSHILGSLPDVHIEVEPHALWKSGNFKYLNDEEYDTTDKITANIYNKLTKGLSGKILIEKSPINCLRPYLVHKVFPEAKIVYMERDPVRCIYSNYSRSLKKDSFKLSIILKKYFVYTGSQDLDGAISERRLFRQISFRDIPLFLQYSVKMFYLRQVVGALPFGPKLKNFATIVKKKGLLYYHVAVFKAAKRYKKIYSELYGSNMQTFSMENIMNDRSEIRRMLDFIQFSCPEEWIQKIQNSFDGERVKESSETKAEDKEILTLLSDNDTGSSFL